MNWLIEPFQFEFMQRSLLAGALVVVITSTVGVWVVLRGLSFMGDALAHGVLPGIALGTLLGFHPMLGAAVSAVVMVAGIDLVHRRSGLSEDTGIGLLFVGMLALGVIVVSGDRSFAGDLTAILFGDALAVSPTDLIVLTMAAAVAIVVSLFFYRSFLAMSFNEEKAQLLRMNPQLAHFVLLSLVTMAVVTSFSTVGSLLVFAMLVAPPATAILVVRRLGTVIATAIGLGWLAVGSGLLVSWYSGTAAGATIAGMTVLFFFVVLGLRRSPG